MSAAAALLALSAWRVQLPLLGLLGFLYVSYSVNSGFLPESLKLGAANWAFAQLIYLADSLSAPEEDSFNRVPLPSLRPPLPLLLAGLLLLAGYISSFRGQWVFPVSGGLIIALYSAPALGRFRLKNYAVPKLLVNGALFTAVVVLSPAVQRYGLSAATLRAAAYAGAGVFSAALCLSLLLDIRDVAGDAAAGVRTLPVAAGEGRCAAGAALFAAAACAAALLRGDLLGGSFFLLLAAAAAFSPGRGRVYFEAWLACLNLLLLGALAAKAAA